MSQIGKVLHADTWRWSNLRAMGNSPAVKMTIFIPLVGYMVIFNEKILSYIQLSEHIFGKEVLNGASANDSLRLILIYFGLSFLAAGSIIYQFFCPDEVKRFATSIDYVAAARSNIGEFSLKQIENRLIRQLGFESFGELAAVVGFGEGRNAEWGERDAKEEALAKGELTVLDANFRKLNESRLLARISVYILYLVGLLLLSVPALEVFSKVAKVAIKDVF
jgi:hypothetical protein